MTIWGDPVTEGNDPDSSASPLGTGVPPRDGSTPDSAAPKHAAPAAPAAPAVSETPSPAPAHMATSDSPETTAPIDITKGTEEPAATPPVEAADATTTEAATTPDAPAAPDNAYVPKPHAAYASHERESVSDWAKRHRGAIRIVLLVFAIALFGSSLILTRCFGLFAGQEVPDVVGYSEESAKALLKKRGLKVEVREEDTQNVDDDGRVLATDPADGETTSHNGTVTIVVGVVTQKTQEVPNLVGKTKADAANAILATNFFVQDDVVYAYSSSVPAGTVISQAPFAGSKRTRGSSIDLVVSAGPSPSGDDGNPAKEDGKSTVTIPDVEGMSYEDATALLKGMGLKSKRGRDTVDEKLTPGTVAVVAPSVGTSADIGSTVTLSVAAKK